MGDWGAKDLTSESELGLNLTDEENNYTYFARLFWPVDDRIHVFNLASSYVGLISHRYDCGGCYSQPVVLLHLCLELTW